jgi:hypothetical protein
LSYTGIHVVAGSPKFNWFAIAPGKGMMTKDISHLANGIYLLLFQGPSERQTLRLIKQ